MRKITVNLLLITASLLLANASLAASLANTGPSLTIVNNTHNTTFVVSRNRCTYGYVAFHNNEIPKGTTIVQLPSMSTGYNACNFGFEANGNIINVGIASHGVFHLNGCRPYSMSPFSCQSTVNDNYKVTITDAH